METHDQTQEVLTKQEKMRKLLFIGVVSSVLLVIVLNVLELFYSFSIN